MKTRMSFRLLAVLAMAAFVFTSCDEDDDDNKVEMPQSIVDVAVANPDFSVLVAAVQKAGLVDALADPNADLTVFAPTNAAFEALLEQLDYASLDEVPVSVLTSVLLYHVLGEQKTASQLADGYYSTLAAGPAEGTHLSLYKAGADLNASASISAADVMADNGVIHVIDAVLLPPTIVDVALANPSFSILVEAVLKADLAGALSAEGPFTVFAPTNAAFEALFANLEVNGVEDLDVETLTAVLLSHVVEGNVVAADVSSGSVPTLNAEKQLSVEVGSGVRIDGNIQVVLTDVQTTNGVVHVIDGVILP